MTTMTPRKKASRKPLRIRPELLPDSAKYGAFDGREYVMIPVEDFGDWYEDALDSAVIDHIDSLGETGVCTWESDPFRSKNRLRKIPGAVSENASIDQTKKKALTISSRPCRRRRQCNPRP